MPNRRLTNEEFIRKCRKIHGDKYDYSKTEYEVTRAKVTIICLSHGEFNQIAQSHAKGQGCIKCQIEIIKSVNTSHGKINTSEYGTWDSMKGRCYNVNNSSYHHYGGRGITVCQEWRNSFEIFYKDIGPKPAKEYTLDRIDNDKGYSKENCRWATPKEQANNRKNTVIIEYAGIRKTKSAWAEISNIPMATLSTWVRNKADIDKMFTKYKVNEKL